MSVPVTCIHGNIYIEFDEGKFDMWCVYLTKPGKPKFAPRDTEYFSFLKKMAKIHGIQKVYSDFKRIYHQTTAVIKPASLELISKISKSYGENAEEAEVWFSIIYAGMVAEENKEKAKLKKRIKRLGIHQLLVEGFTPEQAATYSRGKTWEELDLEMRNLGF